MTAVLGPTCEICKHTVYECQGIQNGFIKCFSSIQKYRVFFDDSTHFKDTYLLCVSHQLWIRPSEFSRFSNKIIEIFRSCYIYRIKIFLILHEIPVAGIVSSG
jgi:hypothetical protein